MENNWQPIETAPKDGRELVLFYPEYRLRGLGDTKHKVEGSRIESGVVIGGKIAIAYYYDSEEGEREIFGRGYWQTLNGQNLGALAESEPSHWMPLPQPPQKQPK